MNQNKKAFTFVELTISIFILTIIIVWISVSLVNISKNFFDSNLKIDIFSQVKDFTFNTYFLNYNSWIILTWGILLYDDKKWVLIWSFLDEFWWYDYKLNYDQLKYDKNFFWYFYINENTLSWILNENIDINNLKFNDWKIYNKLIIKDIFIKKYDNLDLYDLEINFFKNYIDDFKWKIKKDLFLQKEEYLKFNINF